jgi:hypothetical protein
VIELGHGYTAERTSHEGVLYGFVITGNAAPACRMGDQGRCGGCVKVDGPDGWTLVSEDPLTLEPSVKCGCGGQHLHVRDGRAELYSDDVAGER